MPDVMDLFPHLEKLDALPLQIRRDELLAVPDPKSDDVLRELMCVLRILRTKPSAGSRTGRTPGEKKVAPSLDML